MISIAAVVAVGIMVVLTMRGTYNSLELSRSLYYQQSRFPDVWANLERAPLSLIQRIQNIPGVAVADSRISFAATLDVPSIDVPALGQFVSIPENHRPLLSDLHLRQGRYITSGHSDEVIVSENFALANEFIPGDTLRAVINGRLKDLKIVGTAISPEYTYAVPPGALYPEDERFGIVWMGEDALGPVFDMDGAFNEVILTFGPKADANRIISELDRVLEPYGGLGAFPRADQLSHQILESELEQNRSMGTVIPVIFLAVAAFLLNIVLNRMIATQRTEIAVLKAFGYSNIEVGVHYLSFAMVAVMLGTLVGIGLGIWLGGEMVTLYGDFFDFPTLRYEVSYGLIGIAVGVSAAAAAIGAMGAVRRAVQLPPAEAMRPEPPARFKPGLLHRLGLERLLPTAATMIVRNIERKPFRTTMSATGVAFALAILVVGMFMFDSIFYMMDLQFRMAQREDMALTFNSPLPRSVEHSIRNLDGVTKVEPYRFVPVRLRSGHREHEVAVTGLEAGTRLRRIISADGRQHPLPPEGFVISKYLATDLNVSVGDYVSVDVLEGQRIKTTVQIVGIVEDFFGLSVYMQLDALNRLTRGARSVSGVFLLVTDGYESRINKKLKGLPAVASVASPAQTLASFEKQLDEGMYISIFFMLGFSGVIAIAVIYNGARVGLSERGRELASLRVMGFSRREVAILLLGEQAIITIMAIPVGWIIGYGLAAALTLSIQTETFRIPFIVSTATFVYAALATIIAAVASGLLVRRRLNRMDLIQVLKTRE
ncbi:MAG: ABC transporter permease [Rhodothermales bacterium]|nr:ABC transporter permease [Rhodothermales bacterium]